jgi:hypothetical protein
MKPSSKSHPIFRAAFWAAGVLAASFGFAVWMGALAACDSLSDTSPIPTGDASDLDAGFMPVLDEAGGGGPGTALDGGPPPPSGRVRLAHLIQGAGPVDLCALGDAPGSQWQGQMVTHPGGLNYGDVSSHAFVSVPTSAGSKYQFRVIQYGGDCASDAGGGALVSIPAGTSTLLKQGGGLTIAAVGVASAAPGTEAAPKGVVASDVLAPPAAVALLRVVHGVSDLAPFDILINAETAIQGVKYASVLGFPYSSPSGFASLAGGIPQNATLTLKSGTVVRNFTVPDRVRRGVASTIFAGGRVAGSPALTVALCADRSPPEGETLATCTTLQEVK